MNPNLQAILEELRFWAENTAACKFIFAACMIGIIGYGWRTVWRGIKITGDVLHHLRSNDCENDCEDDWEVE